MFTASCGLADELHAGESRVAISARYQQNKNRVESFQPHSFDQVQRKGDMFSDCNSKKKIKKKEKNKHSHRKMRGQRGQEVMQSLFWVEAKSCGRSSRRKRDYEGGNPSTTDTEHLQLLSLN